MINSEFIKSMNCNFERIKLEEMPEEKRYQYCIVNRGGIKGLLPCSLRMINGDAYLYYDITSKQGLSQIFRKKQIGRQWIKDFTWNLKKISQELNRFLLDGSNVIWYPENIYQDLDDNRWSYLYYPYYKGDNGFRSLLEFIIEKIDYSDEALVECVYKIYEQYENYGDDYLADKIYKDVEMLNCVDEAEPEVAEDISELEDDVKATGKSNIKANTKVNINTDIYATTDTTNFERATDAYESIGKCKDTAVSAPIKEKRGLLSFLENSKKKDKELREKNRRNNHYIMDMGDDLGKVNGVAEEADFYKIDTNGTEDRSFEIEETIIKKTGAEKNTIRKAGNGKTVYIEGIAENKDSRRRIYDADGKMLCLLEQESVVIGKKHDEADMIIDNTSVSRIHARIYYADGDYMLEDLNSTNGTFKNGMRLRPYEKRKLSIGDEIKLGSVALMYG